MMGGMGATGAATGALMSAGQSIGEGLFSAWSQRKSRSDWRKSLLRGPTYMMEGLRRAGLNPILAAGGAGGGVASARTFHQQAMQPGGKDVAGGARAGMEAMRMNKLMYYQTMEAEARAGDAQNRKIISDAVREEAWTKWRLDKPIWNAKGDRLRGTHLEREALFGGGNPVSSAAQVLRSLK